MMKKVSLFLIILITIFFSSFNLKAIDIQVFGGMSIPSDKMENVFDKSLTGSIKDSINDVLSTGISTGYNLGLKVLMSLDEDEKFFLTFTLGVHRFPQTESNVVSSIDSSVLGKILINRNIVPITAGIDYYFFNGKLFDLFLCGELQYNNISNSYDVEYGETIIPVPPTRSDVRIGTSIGGGFIIDLGVVQSGLMMKYNLPNFIGKADKEVSESFYSISLFVGL